MYCIGFASSITFLEVSCTPSCLFYSEQSTNEELNFQTLLLRDYECHYVIEQTKENRLSNDDRWERLLNHTVSWNPALLVDIRDKFSSEQSQQFSLPRSQSKIFQSEKECPSSTVNLERALASELDKRSIQDIFSNPLMECTQHSESSHRWH